MTERDVFESRLRAALLRHVADGPTDFDALGFARTVAAKEPRRRGLAPVLSRRWVAVPRVAWTLLLAGLVAAMIGGALLVGSQMQGRLPPVGQLFECPPGSTPDTPGPVDQARPLEPSAVAFDRRAGRLVVLANATDLWSFDARTRTWTDRGVETWTFDVCTNTWTRMHPNQEPRSFDRTELVYDVDSDLTTGVLGLNEGDPRNVWAYDLQANTWTEKGVAPDGASLMAYDPVSGLVAAASREAADPSGSLELWDYDVDTDTWTPLHQANRLGPRYYGASAYDASADRIVEFTRGRPDEIWLLDIRTGTWSKSGAKSPDFPLGLWTALPAIVYDEKAERTVAVGGAVAAYDTAADRWEVLVEAGSGGGLAGLTVYDPVNGRLVGLSEVVGLSEGGTVDGAVVAFDLETRQWTVLLEWSETQPRREGASLRPLDLVEGSPHAEP